MRYRIEQLLLAYAYAGLGIRRAVSIVITEVCR